MLKNYARWITHHPLWVMVFSLLVVVIACAGMGRLSFNSDLRIYFDKHNPQIAALDHMEETYTKVDNVLFVLAPKNGVFNRETLTAVEDLTARAWKIPFSSRVDSITNFKHSSAEGDDVAVDDLVINAAKLRNDQLAQVREIALAEPLLVNRAIAPDAKVTGVNVTVNIPKDKALTSTPQVVKYVRDLAAEMMQKYPDIEIHLTGVVMMNNAFAESSELDMKTLVPAMLTIALIIMGIIMRSWLASSAALVVLSLAITCAMGFAGWFGILLNPVSLNAPNIILTIAICDCVHLLMAYQLALRKGLSKQEAMTQSLCDNFGALLITSLTTCAGFMTLNFSEAPPFRDLGNITTLGVALAFLFTVSFLPAFMMFFKVRAQHSNDNSKLQQTLDKLANSIIAKPKTYVLASLAFVAIASAGIFNNVLNDEFVKYFDKSVKFRQDTDFTAEHLTGIYYIDYELAGKTTSGVNEPAYLQTLGEFTDWLRAQPEVLHVNSISDIYKRLNMNMNGDDPQAYRLPDSSDLAAQYLLMYEMSLPYGMDLRDRVNADKSATRVTATLKNLSSNQVLGFDGRVQSWLKAHDQAVAHSDGTGLTIMFAHIGLRNIKSMLLGTFVALVIISALLMVIFRSFKYGFISLIPNLLPAAMAFGVWGLLVGQIGLALSVMSAMTLGIVVDDTVHFLSKYLKARREQQLNAAEAVRYAYHSVGEALVTTTIALTAGFAVLGFSSFEVNSGMGILTALAIALALILDLLLLPALLLLIDSPQTATAAQTQVLPETAADVVSN